MSKIAGIEKAKNNEAPKTNTKKERRNEIIAQFFTTTVTAILYLLFV